ncbi:MAG TPA: Crp/Fnr family transcriptional regulator [Thermomicrobiales bacterium]
MPPPSLPGLLAEHPLFINLSAETRAAVGARMAPRRYPRGAIIFSEGEPATALHLVGDGTVRIVKRSPNGREQTLLFADAGETFAEIPIFDHGPYPAGAEAFTDTLIYALPAADVLHLLRTVPAFAESALAIFSSRNRHLTEIVENLAFRPVIGRVAQTLLDDPHEQTQTQMAAMVGAAREMVNRSLHTLEREGIIAMVGGRIAIRDRNRLAEIAADA